VNSEPRYLFVYGTLMTAAAADYPMARWLSERADAVGEGSIRGRLYQIKHYPGLVESDHLSDRVFGELFRLRDADTSTVLAKLDDYEGCGPTAPRPTLYVRVVRDIVRADQSNVAAWVYLYNHPVTELRRIVSGRFLQP